MTKEHLELINILRNYQPDIDSINIMMDTPIKVLDIDSLDFVELIFDIESHFGIEIPNEVLGELATVGDFVQCIALSKEEDTNDT